MSTVLTDAEEIDRILRSYPWLDCELATLLNGELVIHAGIDLHLPPGVPPDVRIHFEDVAFIASRCDWHTDTSQTIFSILHEGETTDLNLPFWVDPGYSNYQLRAELPDTSCRIAARSVKLIQLRPPPDTRGLVR